MDDIEDNYKMIKFEKKTKSLDITKTKKRRINLNCPFQTVK